MSLPTSTGDGGNGVLHRARQAVTGILQAYSGIVFIDRPLLGIAFVAGTFWFPNVGLAGLLGAGVGMAVGYAIRLPDPGSGVNVYSSLLVGLSLGAYYALTPGLVLLIVLSAAMTVFLAATLRSFLWQLGHLPVLSLPFVVVALTAALAADTYGGLVPYYEPAALPPALLGGTTSAGAWADTFLSALGSTYFTPHPLVGTVLFAGIVLRSRFLALLCLTGFLSGHLVFTILMAEPLPGLLAWTGFNFSLTAMALGGIFSVPSVSGFVIAMLGAAASAVVTAALTRLLVVYNLPVMALPFLLTTLTLLAALRLRISTKPPILLLEQPGLPEANYEKARLARSRLGSLASLPVLPPFVGTWQIYQGFDGPHTHQGQWRFALDFHRLENGQSYSGTGERLEDFHCFGLPVFSPVYGLVVEVRDTLPDNPPGELDLTNNWGNHVLIQTDDGFFALLAHLQQNSVTIAEGMRVTPNTRIAACGNSGRSPQPHLHLQVQRHRSLGGATEPFHLVSSIVTAAQRPPKYETVVATLEQGWSVQRAQEDSGLAAALQLPVGREFEYEFRDFSGNMSTATLGVEVTLLGQYRLHAGKASAAFERRNATLAFYDRQGPANALLDAWLLAIGLTPLSAAPHSWHDEPPAKLAPLALWQRALLAALRPLGGALTSTYEREWSDKDGAFIQRGQHRLAVTGIGCEIESQAVLVPGKGCERFSVSIDGRTATAQLTNVRQRADAGIPGWDDRAIANTAKQSRHEVANIENQDA